MYWIRTKLSEFPPAEANKVASTWELLNELHPPPAGDAGEMLSYCTKIIIAAQEARRALHNGCYAPRSYAPPRPREVGASALTQLAALGITEAEFDDLLKQTGVLK
jgi:hypothetical protein